MNVCTYITPLIEIFIVTINKDKTNIIKIWNIEHYYSY